MKKIHCRCVFCGRRVSLDTLAKIHGMNLWLQEFGWYRRQKAPTMRWTEINDPCAMESVRKQIIAKLALVAKSFGFKLVPDEKAFAVAFKTVSSGFAFAAPTQAIFHVKEVKYSDR